MNDIQILKEIAFYSKYIEQKKQLLSSNIIVKPTPVPQYNKYKYVKKNTTVIAPVQPNSNSILINPNFKPTVLINPHFQQNKKIHVNPKVLHTLKPEEKKAMPSHSTPKTSEVCKFSPRRRRLSIRSKYKIVKSTCLNTSTKPLSTKYSVKNKYKIDRRSVSNKSLIKKRVIRHGISDILRNNLFKWKKSSVINQFRSQSRSNTRLTNISGIFYKKTQTKLQKVQPNSSKHKKSLVVIKGQKYTIARNKKSLKRILSSSKIQKTKIKHKSVNRTNTSLKTTRKIRVQQRNKLRKNNQPCPVYRRYGNCRRKDAGKCFFLHNPNQIFLCKKFLQGACIDKDCLLSHKVSLEKMPTCKYFLEGCCVRNDCPYLHVKINPKADICRQFLEGFCEKGSECNLRHQFLCPDFEKSGSCSKRKCMYPHKSKSENEKPKVKVRGEKDKKEIEKIEEPADAVRYYVDSLGDQVTKHIQNNNSNLCSEDERPKRPQLGVLPSFIPFNM